jgi:hypothetical protein
VSVDLAVGLYTATYGNPEALQAIPSGLLSAELDLLILRFVWFWAIYYTCECDLLIRCPHLCEGWHRAIERRLHRGESRSD